MTEQSLKSGYIGYEGMGKPIPLTHRQAACKACVQYGCDEKTAGDVVMKMAKLLEHNMPHEAMLSARDAGTGLTIPRVYHLIYVLMTGEG